MKFLFGIIATIVFIVSLLISGRDRDGIDWTSKTVLPSGHEINDILFLNDKTGFLFGVYEPDSLIQSKDTFKIVSERDSVIYKTTDGGKSWLTTYKNKAYVTPIGFLGSNGYAIQTKYSGDRDSKSYILLKTSDLGATWSEVGELPFLCHGGAVVYPNKIFLSGVRKKLKGEECANYLMISSSDEGKSWEEVNFVRRPVFSTPYSVLSKKGFLAYFIDNVLIIKDLSTGVEKIEPSFDGEKTKLLSIDQNDDLWLIESEGENIILHKRNNDGLFSIKATANVAKEFSPKYFHAFDNTLALWGMKITEGLFFPSWHMYRSEDSGKTWTKESPPFTMQANPVAFWGKDNIWAMGLGGSIQVRIKKQANKA